MNKPRMIEHQTHTLEEIIPITPSGSLTLQNKGGSIKITITRTNGFFAFRIETKHTVNDECIAEYFMYFYSKSDLIEYLNGNRIKYEQERTIRR